MILNEEVFAVILALTIVSSVFGIAMLLRPSTVEPFTAIGLLDENCKIGYYPKYVVPGQNLTLCLFVDNHLGKPMYWKIVYRIGNSSTIPTNTTPSPEPAIEEWRGVLPDKGNTTFKIRIPIAIPKDLANAKRIALIFELWIYSPEQGRWIYSGRWTHLYVEVVRR